MFRFKLLGLAAAAALVAGCGGGSGAVAPSTDPTIGVVTNSVLPGADTNVVAGQGVAVMADATATKAPITSHKWSVTQVGGAAVTAAQTPTIADANCAAASTVAGVTPTAAQPSGKDGRSICSTYIVVPEGTPSSAWQVTSTAASAAGAASGKFVLKVGAVDSTIGLTLSVPTTPKFFPVDSTATLSASSTVKPGVTLDTPVAYTWTQIAGPVVTLAGAETSNITFVPRASGDYAFQVKAVASAAGRIDTKQANVLVTVAAAAPVGLQVAVPASPMSVAMGGTATATASYTVNSGVTLDGPVTYRWSQVSGPATTLSNANSASVSFPASAAGDYVLKVTATASSNGRTDSKDAALVVSVTDPSQPAFVVSAGDAQAVKVNDPVLLPGTVTAGSMTPTTPVTYKWTQVSGPATTIANDNTLNASFVATAAGKYIFQLSVTSNGVTQSAVTVVNAI